METSGASISKRESAAVAAVLLVASAAALLALPPTIRGHDGPGHYAYLRSVLVSGDLDLHDDYAAFDRINAGRGFDFRLADAPVSPVTGRPSNRYGIGAALFWAPFVIPVHLVLGRLAPELADGSSPPYETAVGVASAWWGCLALWMLWGWLREKHTIGATLFSMAAITLATPLGFYVWAHGSMAHAVSFFVTTCAMLALDRWVRERRPMQAALFGCWCAMIAVTRAQDSTWSIVLLAVFAGRALCGGSSCPPIPVRAKLASLLLAGAGFILALLPQLAVWRILYGGWLIGPAPYMNREGGEFSAFPVHLLSALFSGRHGALSWHPLLLIALFGLVLGATARKSDRHAGRWLMWTGIAGFAAQLWLVGCWSMWWAGASFGNRFFISSYPFLVVGLACLVAWLNTRPFGRWIIPPAAFFLILWNGGLLIQYGAEIIPREAGVPMFEIILNQFAEVPGWLLDRLLP